MCERIRFENGQVAILCGVRSRQRYCATCGRPAMALCDWKVAANKSGTCDAPCCAQHSKQVASGKHLCPDHQVKYDEWKRQHPSPQRNLFEDAA